MTRPTRSIFTIMLGLLISAIAEILLRAASTSINFTALDSAHYKWAMRHLELCQHIVQSKDLQARSLRQFSRHFRVM